ncbi:hemin uptake protein HemP [Devosia lacusdianchii]|jgi:hemin uptake protein HemP|uniref:hemin uptake protein HemP n=1 Tax=Devosia lacusdianchii TaxID=2917991 RepID=UPI001F06E5E3|nr:hemin uptake protein HemP [Devosia sp. JXJ CY 41]
MPASTGPHAADPTVDTPKIITSAALFEGSGEVLILHNGVPYRLRITRQDKLILTK